MRTIHLLLMMLAAGCSSRMFIDDGHGHALPAEAVQHYADAHGLSRREAARELGLLRDANYLKELRTAPSQPDETPSPRSKAASDTSSLSTP